MKFLTNTDLESQLFEEFIDNEDAADVLIVNDIESKMIALFKSKLRIRYDVEAIFSADEADRDELIITHLTALVIYKIIKRNAARKVPSDAVDEWKAAMKWLNDVRDGIESPDLPVVADTPHKEVYWGNSRNEDLYY
jgi:hypothetical protein